MRCCGSPTTSTAGNSAEAVRAAQSALQAVLFTELLAPLVKNLGPVGDAVAGSVAQTLFVPGRS